MMLQYTDILGDGKPHRINATITTEHSSSSYGIPALLLDDGNPLDASSWALMGYRVISISRAELPLMERWLGNLYSMLGMASGAAALGRKGGSVRSEAKTKAVRENAKKGGWPKGKPRKPPTD